jgi:hypothetical protein
MWRYGQEIISEDVQTRVTEDPREKSERNA